MQPYMSLGDVAAYLGVTRQAAFYWSQRAEFPAPVALLKMGAVWSTDAVVKFMADRLHRKASRRTDVFAMARERLAALVGLH